MIYAGIGSRETPENVQFIMYDLAQKFAQLGYMLRSGRADGADKAFEHGCASMGGRGEIWLPGHVGDNSPWLAHAAMFHPAWNRCGPFAKKLHARNSAIILGAFLNVPVQFVVCWTKDGGPTGGTGQALRIAGSDIYRIPVFNLQQPDALERLYKFIGWTK